MCWHMSTYKATNQSVTHCCVKSLYCYKLLDVIVRLGQKVMQKVSYQYSQHYVEYCLMQLLTIYFVILNFVFGKLYSIRCYYSYYLPEEMDKLLLSWLIILWQMCIGNFLVSSYRFTCFCICLLIHSFNLQPPFSYCICINLICTYHNKI